MSYTSLALCQFDPQENSTAYLASCMKDTLAFECCIVGGHAQFCNPTSVTSISFDQKSPLSQSSNPVKNEAISNQVSAICSKRGCYNAVRGQPAHFPCSNTAMQRGLRYLGALTIPNTRRRIPSSAAACCYHSTASPVPSTSAVTLDSPQTYSLNDDPRETGHATLSEDTNQVVDDDKAEQPSRGRGAKIRPSKYGTTHPTADLSTSSLKSFTSSDIKFERPTNPNSKAKIARLAHDLQRVLHNPGQIHRMKDPRSKEEISNFDTRISQIPSPEEMNMPALSVFTKPSEDPVLVCSSLGRCSSSSLMVKANRQN